MYQEIGESPDQLRIDMAWHALNGYIYACADSFAMARPVSTQDATEDVLDYTRGFELTNDQNCWHIHIAVGNMKHLLSLLPYQLPFISFERRGKLRLYRYDRFIAQRSC